MTTLIQRGARVMASDHGYLASMLLLPVAFGLLINVLGGSQGLRGAHNGNAEQTLLLLVIGACLIGAASSVRELVKERPIYIREWATGLSSGAYLCSKLLVLGAIGLVQSLILVLAALSTRPLPPSGSFLAGTPLIELLLATAALTLASMCLGLLVSALVSTPQRATPILVLLTAVQAILSGGVIHLSRIAGLAQLSWIVPARWGFGAVASTADLNHLNPGTGSLTDALWAHTSQVWLRDMAFLIGLGVVFALLAWVRLRRVVPG